MYKSLFGVVRSKPSLNTSLKWAQVIWRNQACRFNSDFASLFTSEKPQCISCGSALQQVDANKFGFYKPQKAEPRIKYSEAKYQKIYDSLSKEDRELLIRQDSKATKKNVLPTKKIEVPLLNPNQVVCELCKKALHHEKYQFHEHKVVSFEDVLTDISVLAPIVHVVSAQDFPMTLAPQVFQFREPNQIHVVITKLDLFYSMATTCNKNGQFFKDYLYRKYRIPSENVHLCSGMIDWNIKELIENLPDAAHLVGEVNTGKSTLIKSLIYTDNKYYQKQFMNKKNQKLIEKEQDFLANNPQVEIKTYSTKKRERIFEEKFKAKNGPGVAYMPGFTQSRNKFELPNIGKSVFDVPGFEIVANHGIYQWLKDKEAIKKMSKGVKFYKHGMFDSHYETVKSGQVATIGGLFFLQIPENAMIQLRNCINADFLQFKNIERAKEVFSNSDNDNAIKNKFLVKPQVSEKLVKFAIPPFFGSIDLVIKGAGYINIKPVGRKLNTEPFMVYALPGTEILIRQPISKYTSKSLTGRDAKGNPLRPEKWVTHSTKEVQKYKGDKFTSRLVEIPPHIDNIPKYVKSYCKDINNVTSDNPVSQLEVNDRYWIEA